MSIDAVDSELDYTMGEIGQREEGSDGQRTYTLLEKGEYCIRCDKNFRMRELGIEKISFQVYQLADGKFFDMDFNVTGSGGKVACLHFSNRAVSAYKSIEFFSELKNIAIASGALGLATLANQAMIAAHNQLPPDKSSQYYRCMLGCDRVEFEPFKLLCYLACTIWADDKPDT